MKKKKGFLKRNSGFIIGCVLAGGASFTTANVLMSDSISGIQLGTEMENPQDGNRSTGTLEPESPARTAFETDPFTVTASGSVVNGVESEPPQTETTASQTEETNADEGTYSDGNSEYYGEGEYYGDDGSGEWVDDGSDWSGDEWSDDGSDWSGDDGSGEWVDDGSGWSGDDGSGWSGDDGSGWSGDDGSGDWSGDGGSDWSGDGGSDWNGDGGSSGDDGSSGGEDNPGGDDSQEVPVTPSEVIIQGISSRYIDASELYNYDLDELRLIRNEIFALHGRIFKSQELADYFSQRPWYVPTYDPDEFDANMFDYLNEYEEANLQVILEYEAQLGGGN